MRKARCGNPDLGTVNTVKQPMGAAGVATARVAQGRSGGDAAPQSLATPNIWPKTHLKWFIENYPTNQNEFTKRERVVEVIKQAFHDWEKHSALRFEMAKSAKDADLKVRFHTKDHGDGYPFDGPGVTLAHAFFPKSGEIHFDDDEKFTLSYDQKPEKYNLRFVAAHEIGHSLGLSHSFEEESLMFPTYQAFEANYNISVNDQKDIQTLYGKPEEKEKEKKNEPTQSPSAATRAPTVLPSNNWCSNDFQTACEGPDGNLYLFKDQEVWRYRGRGKNAWDQRPRLIRDVFPTLGDVIITACVRSTKGFTYLFRNYRMWRITTHWQLDGPHIIEGHNYPQNPRVALVHQNAIYLVRNRMLFRLNEADYDRTLEIRRLESILSPLPEEFIRSGFTYAKRHYLFTENDVFVYDARNGQLLPGYPRARSNGWFACENNNNNNAAASPINKKTSKPPNRKKDRHHDRHHHHHHSHEH